MYGSGKTGIRFRKFIDRAPIVGGKLIVGVRITYYEGGHHRELPLDAQIDSATSLSIRPRTWWDPLLEGADDVSALPENADAAAIPAQRSPAPVLTVATPAATDLPIKGRGTLNPGAHRKGNIGLVLARSLDEKLGLMPSTGIVEYYLAEGGVHVTPAYALSVQVIGDGGLRWPASPDETDVVFLNRPEKRPALIGDDLWGCWRILVDGPRNTFSLWVPHGF